VCEEYLLLSVRINKRDTIINVVQYSLLLVQGAGRWNFKARRCRLEININGTGV
jgi:hypothetical protein